METTNSRGRAWNLRPPLVAIAALLVGFSGCRDDFSGDTGITVMTQNVYFGFDVNPLLAATDPEEIPVLAAQAFQQLLATDFASRAAAMADKIAQERPHLIGLQEVALFRIQSPGDAVIGGSTPAETVLFDHLEMLLSALAARDATYRVAGKIQNVDVELPMLAGIDPPAFDDIRLTDFDVVLARGDVDVTDVVASNYDARLFIPALGLEVPRGFVAVSAGLHPGMRIRFVSTHLEDLPFEEIQQAQAEELAARFALEPGPVVLVGDFNSPAPSGATYEFLDSRGYRDVWTWNSREGEGEGLTWGHDPDLLNETAAFTMRLDLVWVRRHQASPMSWSRMIVSSEVWGDEPDEKTETGLWPSDHGGVLATLFFTSGSHASHH